MVGPCQFRLPNWRASTKFAKLPMAFHFGLPLTFSITDTGWMQADGGGSLEDSGVTKGGGCYKLMHVGIAVAR